MSTRHLVAVSAGLSQPSSTRLLADRLVADTVAALDLRGMSTVVTTIELRELAHEITDNLLTGFPAPRLDAAITTLTGADGVIAVTPIFTASYSGLFKSFFDVVDASALIGVPVLMGATAGTARHSLALEHEMRPLFSYLRTVITPTAVFAASEDWGSAGAGGTLGRDLSARMSRAAGELATLIAMRESAEAPVPGPDLLSGLVPFAEHLGRR
jgi:FMN reductase